MGIPPAFLIPTPAQAETDYFTAYKVAMLPAATHTQDTSRCSASGPDILLE